MSRTDQMQSKLRTFQSTDLGDALALSDAERWPHKLADWEMMFNLGEGLVVEEPDNRISGTILWWTWGWNTATIGMIIVARDRQRRGLGRALVAAALAAIGERTVLLHATAEGAPLYRSFGFVECALIQQWQGTLAQPNAQPPQTNIERTSSFDLLRGADAGAFGAERLRLVEALDNAGSVFANKPEDAIAVRRRFGHGWHVGPLHAKDERSAISVFRSSMGDGFNRVDLVDPSPGLQETARELGLAHVDTAMAMVRGQWPQSESGWRKYGLVTQALG